LAKSELVHYDYNNVELPELLAETAEALLDPIDDGLIRVLEQREQVRLNPERGALQVFTADGSVAFHVRLDVEQFERLSSALAAGRTRRP
jgi:hypothetical protein